MPSRRAQRRDGTRKSRRPVDYWTILTEQEYRDAMTAWMRGGPFRPVDPPTRGVANKADEKLR